MPETPIAAPLASEQNETTRAAGTNKRAAGTNKRALTQ